MKDFTFPIDLPNVEILKTQAIGNGDFLISIESTLKKARCPRCRKKSKTFHGFAAPIRLRHMDILGHRCFVEIRPKRFVCDHCDKSTFTQRLTWYDPKSRVTKAFAKWTLMSLANSTFADVSEKLRVSISTVRSIFRRQVKETVDWNEFEALPTLGIDEVALRKGHKHFATVVYTRTEEKTRVVAVLKDRKKETVVAFLKSIPQRLKATIKTFCVDMYRGFDSAIKEVFGETKAIVIDRFHVVKNVNDAVDKVRKSELKRLRESLTKEEYTELKGCMWDCRKNEAVKPNSALEKFLNLSPVFKRARELRIALKTKLDTIDNVVGGRISLGRWLKDVERSKIKKLQGIVTTFRNWWAGITEYFEDFQSSGFVEGLNNRLKMMKRRCFGLNTVSSLFRRLKLDLNARTWFSYATV